MTMVLDVLKERGFVEQVTDEPALREALTKGPTTVYVGYDATATSLHVGNLFTLMALRHLENAGHKPIVLLGGGTTMVGDPSGKTEMRPILAREVVQQNLAQLRLQIAKFLGVEAGTTQIVDNAEWLFDLKLIDFLRDIGRHFSVNRMLAAEAYKQRLERGLSFIELNYQLLQAYDFLELYTRYGCTVQMGGNDQWGNIIAGVDLCRRVRQAQVFGLTFPLLLTTSGQKMGKTAAGAVWLDAEQFSPFDFYQYWVNLDDADVERMLAIYTFLPIEEIRQVHHLEGAKLNLAKSILAYEVTKLIHGEVAAQKAHAAALAAFGDREVPYDILPSSTLPRGQNAGVEHIPSLSRTLAEVTAGLELLQVLVDAGLAGSKNEARRLVRQGAVRINELVVTDEHAYISQEQFENGGLTLRCGKKKIHRLVLV